MRIALIWPKTNENRSHPDRIGPDSMAKHDKERKRRQKTYGHMYRRHRGETIDRDSCFYCGAPAEHLDHCPPLAWIDSRTSEQWRDASIPIVLLPSCGKCNQALGDKPLFTALDRLLHLENMLDVQYEKGAALWSDAELEDMSESFKHAIQTRRRALADLLARLRHVQWRVIHDETFPEV